MDQKAPLKEKKLKKSTWPVPVKEKGKGKVLKKSTWPVPVKGKEKELKKSTWPVPVKGKGLKKSTSPLKEKGPQGLENSGDFFQESERKKAFTELYALLGKRNCKMLMKISSLLTISQDSALVITCIFLALGDKNTKLFANTVVFIFGKELSFATMGQLFSKCKCKRAFRQFAKKYVGELCQFSSIEMQGTKMKGLLEKV